MKILALEFSSALRSVAVADLNDNGERKILSSTEDADFRAVTNLTLIDRALHTARLKPADISLIALGLGPGSYTGIRSGIAIAQGWQLGRHVQTIGLSSVLCLAEEARARGISGEVTILIDAQRGDVYLQTFRLSQNAATALDSLRIITKTAIPNTGIFVGPEASDFVSGALNLSPSAATLARLANPAAAMPAEQLEPIYLRETTFVKARPGRRTDPFP
jgi:tRNA threonylcarbamoyladenosine biosynthesis protein TsaB